LDVGEKRIGLAITDELALLASPYGCIDRAEAIRKLEGIIQKESVSRLIVGLPYLENGQAGSQSVDIKKFVELLKRFDLPIEFENELLTSVEAATRLKAMGKKSIQKGDIDVMAATIILESYLKGKNG
jgi:putative Holliday junction resolvase